MKTATFILAAIGFSCFNFLCNAQILDHCSAEAIVLSDTYTCEEYDDWVLVFEDHFDDPNGIDYDNWRNDYPWGRNLVSAGQLNYYTDGDNFDISNGKLTITAEQETVYERVLPDFADDYILSDGGQNKRLFYFTSGMLFSEGEYVFGRFEIRCKIPSIRGTGPSFWLYTHCAQEIDVFEFLSSTSNSTTNSKEVYTMYHRKEDCDSDDEKIQCGDHYTSTSDMSDDFHTYAVEWDQQKIVWYVDGNSVLAKYRWHTVTNQAYEFSCGENIFGTYLKDQIFPLEVPMNVILTLSVKPYAYTRNFPVDLEVDYIRIYQRINSSGSVEINSKADINGSSVAGQEITVDGTSGTIVINDGEILSLTAKDEITIVSDFKAEAGAVLSINTNQ